MADEQIRIDVTATDDASDVLDKVADEAAELERLEPEITVTADADQASRAVEDLSDDARALSRQDTEIVLRARIDDAKGQLKALRDDLDQTGDQARRTADQLDKVGDGGSSGIQTRGNAIADLTGPLGEASGAASDFAGVFDGLGDIAGDVAGKVGLSAAAMTTAIGGIGIAVAAAAAVWTIYRGRQEEARKKQEELVKGQRELNDAVKAGEGAKAAQLLIDNYGEAFKAAEQLGVGVSDLTRYITGQSDAIPTLVGRQADLQAQFESIQTSSGSTRDRLAALLVQYDGLVGSIDGARDAYVKANGSIEQQDRVLANVQSALGITEDNTDDLTRANKRAEDQARRTAEGFDRIESSLDIERAALDFRAKLDAALADTRSKADLTAQEVLEIKQSIVDVAEYAGLTPIEVRSYLQRVEDGDVDGVLSDVNHRLANRAVEVETQLKPPSQWQILGTKAAMAAAFGTIEVPVVAVPRSGGYGSRQLPG